MIIIGIIIGIIGTLAMVIYLPFITMRVTNIQAKLLLKQGQNLVNKTGSLAIRVADIVNQVTKNAKD